MLELHTESFAHSLASSHCSPPPSELYSPRMLFFLFCPPRMPPTALENLRYSDGFGPSSLVGMGEGLRDVGRLDASERLREREPPGRNEFSEPDSSRSSSSSS